MAGFTDTLGERLGPLPVWAWGGIAGAGIAGVRYVMSRRSGAGDTEAPGPSSAPAPAAQSVAAQSSEAGSFMAAGTYVPPPAAYSPASPDPSANPIRPADNDEWLATASTLVASGGSIGYLTVSSALSKYLAGETITEAESRLVEQAIKLAGFPPYPAPPVVIASPSTAPLTPTPPAAPAAYRAPTWLAGVKFVKGSGPAIYEVVPNGIEWIPSEDVYRQRGGSFGRAGEPPANYLTIPDSVLATLPRVGAVPDVAADPSLALRS